jgi:hypothetical protein
MRLSEWRALAKPPESMSQKVVDVIEPVLRTLGADDDPHVWVAWGDDPAARYTVLAPTPPGLAVAAVRVNVPQEGPRVAAKLVRWSRVQLSELSVESQRGHRLLSFQLEGQVMKGIDEEADAIARFVNVLFAATDGRPWPSFEPPARRGRATPGPPRTTGKSAKAAAPRS